MNKSLFKQTLLVLLGGIFILGIGYSARAIDWPKPEILNKSNLDVGKDQDILVQVSVPSGYYDYITLEAHEDNPSSYPGLREKMSCQDDVSRTGYLLCTYRWYFSRAKYDTNYYLIAIGVTKKEGYGVAWRSEPVLFRKIFPQASPWIVSPQGNEVIIIDSNVIRNKVVAEERSGMEYLASLVLSDSKGKELRNDPVKFIKNGAKVSFSGGLMMQDAKRKTLPTGDYYLQIFSYRTLADRSRRLNGVASNKVKFYYRYQQPLLKFTAPSFPRTDEALPACQVQFKVAQDLTAAQAAKFSKLTLNSSVDIGPAAAKKIYAMKMDSSGAFFNADLSKIKSSNTGANRFFVNAVGSYQADGKFYGGNVETGRLFFKVLAGQKPAACHKETHGQVLFSKPVTAKLCVGDNGFNLTGPADNKTVWQPGDQTWLWRCNNICLDEVKQVVDCAALAPVLKLSIATANSLAATNLTNDKVNLLLESNVGPNDQAYKMTKVYLRAVGRADNLMMLGAPQGSNGKYILRVNSFDVKRYLGQSEAQLVAIGVVEEKTNPAYNTRGKQYEVWSNKIILNQSGGGSIMD